VAQQLHLYTLHNTTWFQVTQGATTSTFAEIRMHKFCNLFFLYWLWTYHLLISEATVLHENITMNEQSIYRSYIQSNACSCLLASGKINSGKPDWYISNTDSYSNRNRCHFRVDVTTSQKFLCKIYIWHQQISVQEVTYVLIWNKTNINHAALPKSQEFLQKHQHFIQHSAFCYHQY